MIRAVQQVIYMVIDQIRYKQKLGVWLYHARKYKIQEGEIRKITHYSG